MKQKILKKIDGKPHRRGFSIVEIVIVTAIIGIMTGVGLVSLNADRNKKQLETEARKVVASLRQAQNYALVGKMGVSVSAPCKFEWRNFINSGGTGGVPDNNTSYWIRPFSRGGAVDCNTLNVLDDIKYSLENGVIFDSGAESVNFSVPFGSSGDGSLREIVLVKSNYSRHICICGSGNISEKEGDNYCDYGADCL